jgi:hypothetical protein
VGRLTRHRSHGHRKCRASILEGTVEGRKLAFTVYLRTDAGDSAMYFMGEVGEDGRTMKGTLTIEGMGDATWSAKKQPDQ